MIRTPITLGKVMENISFVLVNIMITVIGYCLQIRQCSYTLWRVVCGTNFR